MARYFEIFDKDLKELQKVCKNSRRQLNIATAQILNNMAFKAKSESLRTLKAKLSIKQEKFVAGTIRVQKTKPSIPINKQVSSTGTIKRPRFSGLVEQQTGEATERTRVAALFARGNSAQRSIKPGYRLKKTLKQASEYPGKSIEHRTSAMLRELQTEGFKKPFIIKRHKKFPAGVYRFIRRKVRLIQFLKPRRLQPERYPWLTIAGRRAVRATDVKGILSRAVEQLFRKI